MRLEVNSFKGELPAVAPHRLPPEHAVLAQNCNLEDGDLQPLYGNVIQDNTDIAAGAVKTLFYNRNLSRWFSSVNDLDFVNSPIALDAYGRVYWTGDPSGNAKVTDSSIATVGVGPFPSNDFDLGMPAPGPLAIALEGTIEDDSDPATNEDWNYVATFRNGYGEEGPASLPSNTLEILDPTAQAVRITLPDLTTNTFNVTHYRIYRTKTTGSGTAYFFLTEVPLANTSYVDAPALADSLVNELETEDYIAPPSGVKGLCLGSNGIMACFKDNTVLFSEPYLPYAWPIEYRRGLHDNVVAIKPTATGFVVATEGMPVVIQGIHPNSMAETRIEENQPCLSKRSMVDMGDFAIYASPDGLVGVSESSAEVLTRKLIKRREWNDIYSPSQIIGVRYEDNYLGFTNGSRGAGGFIFNVREGELRWIGETARAMYNDLYQDKTFFVSDADGELYSFDDVSGEGSPRTYNWRSKEFQTPDVDFSVVKVWTDNPNAVGLKVWANGREVMDVASMPQEAIRLPRGKGTRWQFELYGTARVQRITFAQSMAEVAG